MNYMSKYTIELTSDQIEELLQCVKHKRNTINSAINYNCLTIDECNASLLNNKYTNRLKIVKMIENANEKLNALTYEINKYNEIITAIENATIEV